MHDDMRQDSLDRETERRQDMQSFLRRHPEWLEFNTEAQRLGWGPTAAGELADINMRLKDGA